MKPDPRKLTVLGEDAPDPALGARHPVRERATAGGNWASMLRSSPT